MVQLLGAGQVGVEPVAANGIIESKSSVFHVHVKPEVVCGYSKKERPNVLCGERQDNDG